jgi:predicted phage replisome organizer/uncharacterized phage protein (TIGR02220 family)
VIGMAEVKWIKLATKIFDNRKIRQIECLPDGDAIIVIWVKLLCLAGNINDSGLVYFTKEIPYTDQMLATQFNRPLTTVQLALKTFVQFEMVEVIDNILHISNWEKYQSVDRLTEIREYNRLAKQRSREKQKALQSPSEDVNDKSMTSQRCHDTDIDIDKDKEEDKEIYIKVVSHLNEKAGTKYRATTAKTRTAIHARLAEGFTLEDFKTVIDKKCADWLGTEWEKFLRPETLFGTKFEGYLNAKSGKKPTVTTEDYYSGDQLPW